MTLFLSLSVCPPAVSAVVNLFLALAVFGGKCWDRDWLMYPNYNFLSWSFYFAVFSCGFNTIAALLYGMVSGPTASQMCNVYVTLLLRGLMSQPPRSFHHLSAHCY